MGWGMRIIAGSAKRRKIRVPKGETRPTTDFVREAVFSRLAERVVGARVLDLFAGSGAFGTEALSRGASHGVFVDASRAAESAIRENLKSCDFQAGEVVRADVHAWMRRDGRVYDLIFADPPYARTVLDRDHLGELLSEVPWSERISPDGLVLFEQSADAAAGECDSLELLDRRVYGGSAILIYRSRLG